jgi:hypothetical protein
MSQSASLDADLSILTIFDPLRRALTPRFLRVSDQRSFAALDGLHEKCSGRPGSGTPSIIEVRDDLTAGLVLLFRLGRPLLDLWDGVFGWLS